MRPPGTTEVFYRDELRSTTQLRPAVSSRWQMAVLVGAAVRLDLHDVFLRGLAAEVAAADDRLDGAGIEDAGECGAKHRIFGHHGGAVEAAAEDHGPRLVRRGARARRRGSSGVPASRVKATQEKSGSGASVGAGVARHSRAAWPVTIWT